MSLISWIILGGLAGWVASMFVGSNRQQGILGNIVAGIIGGLVGGWIFAAVGGTGITGFNFWSFVVAVIGAIIVLMIWRAISGRRVHE